MAPELNPEQEATRIKALAETKYSNSNLKSALKLVKKAHSLCPKLEGLSSMLTAFEILLVASKPSVGTAPDWYKILQVEPFSNINTIKKQYRKLALILHPDKNPYSGCEEAFKLVGEGFRVFTDKIRRKEYDMKLRIRIQEERVDGFEGGVAEAAADTFWTSCSRCRLLHKFERRYLGHNLVCPSCKKSFEAVEVDGGSVGKKKGDEEEEQETVRVRSERLKKKMGNVESLNGKMVNDDDVSLKEMIGSREKRGNVGLRRKVNSGGLREKETGSDGGKIGGGQWGGGRLRSGGLRRRMSTVGDILARSNAKRVENKETEEGPKLKKAKIVEEEMMTLAEMQLEIKRKVNQANTKMKLNVKDKDDTEKQKRNEKQGASKNKVLEVEKQGVSEKSDLEIVTRGALKRSVNLRAEAQGDVGKKNRNLQNVKRRTSRRKVSLKIERDSDSDSRDSEIMDVEDSDFYNFDKDRSERTFRKGQVWAIYDENDRMPRHYCLIDEVISVNPFEVQMSWLNHDNNGDEGLSCLEKIGIHASCGRFKVTRKDIINRVNSFSHIMDCERAAKQAYRIYPKKGSVWALYDEAALGGEGRNLAPKDELRYSIVVLLTTYSDDYGLSMAYLEKVDGFKTIFKRQEIGCHAIRFLEKDDVRLFSHQIPARKLSRNDVPLLLEDCWELDPASLPSDVLTIGCER